LNQEGDLMTKDWLIENDMNGIVFPDKQILIPITINLNAFPELTINQWVIANLINVISLKNKVILLAAYDYGEQFPKFISFGKLSKNKIVCEILSMTENELKKLIPRIPSRFKRELVINKSKYSKGTTYWAFKEKNKK
jgi:hypothetical protein